MVLFLSEILHDVVASIEVKILSLESAVSISGFPFVFFATIVIFPSGFTWFLIFLFFFFLLLTVFLLFTFFFFIFFLVIFLVIFLLLFLGVTFFFLIFFLFFFLITFFFVVFLVLLFVVFLVFFLFIAFLFFTFLFITFLFILLLFFFLFIFFLFLLGIILNESNTFVYDWRCFVTFNDFNLSELVVVVFVTLHDDILAEIFVSAASSSKEVNALWCFSDS